MEQREAILKELSPEQAHALNYDWDFWARPKQQFPGGDWITWLILAGRGFGKTRVGAEWVRHLAENKLIGRIALIGETAADVRDTMVHGEAGIMAISRPGFRPIHIESRRLVQWPNGVIATTYSGEKPDQLRGPAHGAAWGDEPAKWKYGQDAIDNLMFGLRLGQHPQVCFTTTPRPIKLIKDLVKDLTTHVTRGTTYENLKNLAPAFAKKIISKYEGTRLGRQELNAEILDDVPGALWNRTNIDANRVKTCPDMRRIVVAIDPNVTSGEDADEAGIVVCGLGVDGLGYVLEDATGDEIGEARGPAGWAKRAVAAYKKWQADRIVGEVNNGGEMVGMVIRAVDSNVSYKAVHASRGKVVRAEPISALYEQNRIKHVGSFPVLEDQQCEFTHDFTKEKAGYSPDRMEALVWGFTELGLTEETGWDWS